MGKALSAAERLRVRVKRLLAATPGRHTQKALAAAIGCSQPDISRKLAGQQPFKVEELDRLAAFFNITVAELFFDEYGRFDRRKATRRSGKDRRKVNLFALREDPKPWHNPARIMTPPHLRQNARDDD